MKPQNLFLLAASGFFIVALLSHQSSDTAGATQPQYGFGESAAKAAGDAAGRAVVQGLQNTTIKVELSGRSAAADTADLDARRRLAEKAVSLGLEIPTPAATPNPYPAVTTYRVYLQECNDQTCTRFWLLKSSDPSKDQWVKYPWKRGYKYTVLRTESAERSVLATSYASCPCGCDGQCGGTCGCADCTCGKATVQEVQVQAYAAASADGGGRWFPGKRLVRGIAAAGRFVCCRRR